jgi:hypothetical protein
MLVRKFGYSGSSFVISSLVCEDKVFSFIRFIIFSLFNTSPVSETEKELNALLDCGVGKDPNKKVSDPVCISSVDNLFFLYNCSNKAFPEPV